MGPLDRLIVATLPAIPRAIVGRVASRYVAGSTLQQALKTVRRLNAAGASATVDLLGEEVGERRLAEAATEENVHLLQAIAEQGLDTNVSVKPTLLGLKVSPALCRDCVGRIVEEAGRHGNFVRIDMEDRTTTDATLAIYRELDQRFGNVGVVLQARLRRTLADIAALPRGANVRLCKGIYLEPPEAAWQGFDTIRHNFLAGLEKLLRGDVYVGIATHDELLLAGALALVDRLQVPRDRYEIQMLLGVEERLRDVMLADGHRLRVYVPYGEDWYAYSLRRLRENPEVAGHVMRAMLRRS
ncbi:MAG: proline dehydrogenase family protein [Thermoanaerobaculia bacterium]